MRVRFVYAGVAELVPIGVVVVVVAVVVVVVALLMTGENVLTRAS